MAKFSSRVAIYIVAIMALGNGCKEKDELYLLLDDAEGIRSGTIIKSSGVKIGTVTELGLKDQAALVTVRIDPKHPIPRNSAFKVVLSNILDPKADIEVKFSYSKEVYQSGDTIVIHNKDEVQQPGRPIILDSITKAKILEAIREVGSIVRTLRDTMK
ncbi:MlaD family protein [Terrimonas sp. NA20]|uniref:MlaD family protein n=1 Tax=Terrimonas ginsenosidimutans TaxID=2908004 RepID=A0ABS9KWS5_9BACT|nr:MlaD family protein [Terrimonas ginsenosidimutans]MCG2616775.1 MlaD family protein [Terrimonas ginsenosidimutans]